MRGLARARAANAVIRELAAGANDGGIGGVLCVDFTGDGRRDRLALMDSGGTASAVG